MRVEGVFRAATATVEVPAGTVIFREGDKGNEMYGIIEGTVQLETPTGALVDVGADEVFGEMAIVDHEERTATAMAKTDCVLAVIDSRQFLWLVHETPTFALQVMRTMARRLRHPWESTSTQ
ncbi:MAG TPA: cyclic nucleotide-binding domain-containing protein [Acidimicrobiales bacterium]|nr:cyclic nucleotide-binding domain-containing protein [Acidimicrobiales bacterium]